MGWIMSSSMVSELLIDEGKLIQDKDELTRYEARRCDAMRCEE